MPAPCVVHKYPDRALLLVVDRCAIYCRHCNRRRLVGGDDPPAASELDAGLAYLARATRIRDVLISGGDPHLRATAAPLAWLKWVLPRGGRCVRRAAVGGWSTSLPTCFVRAIFRRQRARARARGLVGAAPGAVTAVQRFGSAAMITMMTTARMLTWNGRDLPSELRPSRRQVRSGIGR